ncbi:MAG TPA: bifunctional diaminohydroxyphosphoribosylaminopyrimidine deaminase/5-amino-6-(5-phosphoribosylamino)uracil reductase RibD [Blastocatellia bacterium]|nr:bifunctional diaminohydroxyphosphoribosylaminopyrimidine deaminase/5-amino-6-(5-phosphoribosylamino)uracil reductase RibD [Blastocatellia bacterium]
MREDDLKYMKRALELAGRGAGSVSPNPMVGAVLVKDGEIIGEGFHRYDKLKHAESYAIAKAGGEARGSTLYCTLEPCSHHGRTPPCTGALIEAGISRAVIAMTDPDRRVNGQGIVQLREAGIKVEVGLCEFEAGRLNEFYLKFVTRGKPFVHALLVRETGYAGGWEPSEALLSEASEYDAIILGSDPSVNRIFVANGLSRERHRPLIVAGDQLILELQDLPDGSLKAVLSAPSLAEAKVLVGSGATGPDSNALLVWLARLQATSALILPGKLSPRDSDDFEVVDRVTALTSSGTAQAGSDSRPGALLGDVRPEGRDVERAGEHSEISGYLRATGSAKEI